MSREGEVQVPRLGQAFPFGSATAPPHPHINQWCRFTIPERLPLKPFRQDRLTRLPLPPSIMATCKVVHNTGAGNFIQTSIPTEKYSGAINPFQKVILLEKNLAFVQESHAEMLKGLHEEIAELKQKNRELLFQVVTGFSALPPDDNSKSIMKDVSEEQKDKIEKLEKEVRKLRGALKDAMKTNSSLTIQLHQLKSEQQYSKPNSHSKVYNTPPDSAIDDGRQSSPSGPSPQMEEYSDTLRQIQRASKHHSGRQRDDRRHRGDDYSNDWSDSYVHHGNGYHQHRHHHRHQAQKSPQQHQQQQPRLPRLPLRNQQNYQQYEKQYRIRSSNTLPALKQPLVPVVDHRLDKPRKSRGPRVPKLADQIANG